MTAKVRSLGDLINQAWFVLNSNPNLGYSGFSNPVSNQNRSLLVNALNQSNSALWNAQQQGIGLNGNKNLHDRDKIQELLEDAPQAIHIVLEIDIALSWLMNAELDRVSNDFTSTCRLPHILRELAKTYISSGSLIIAALILEIPYDREPKSHDNHTVLNFAINRGWLAEQREISYAMSEYEKRQGKKAEPVVKPRFGSELYSLSTSGWF